MKSLFTILAAAVLLAAPLAVQNAYGQVEFTLGAGLNLPSGDYSDEVKAGYAIITGVGYRVMPYVTVGAEISFYGNSATDETLEGYGDGWELKSSIHQYSGVLKVLLPVRQHNVYAKGVVGNYRGSLKVSSPIDNAELSKTDLGYGLGGGLMINGDRSSSLFLDVTYHSIAFDGADANTNFFTFSAGGVFAFNLFN
jgi:hypothetical protein